MAKLLIASLVDPATHPGGAGTYTRGLVAALQRRGHAVDLVAPLHAPPGSWYRPRQLISLARSCISELPAKVLFTRQHEFKERIVETARSGGYDAALVNSGDMGWAIDALPREMPTVLIALNLEHEVLRQQLANSLLLSRIFKQEIVKQRRYEIECFRRVGGVIFLSTTDMAWAYSHVPGLQALYVPPLFTELRIPRNRGPSAHLRLGFLADFAWWPNRRNWDWLINEILPNVRRPIAVHVFGRQSERIPTCEGVVVHGPVRELRAVWDQVDIMICPVRTGAGVNIKLAESLYNGMPVLATTHAARGLDCQSGAGLAIVDGAEEWASFLSSPQADRLATQSPSEELSGQFAADRHAKKLEDFIFKRVIGRETMNCEVPDPTRLQKYSNQTGCS